MLLLLARVPTPISRGLVLWELHADLLEGHPDVGGQIDAGVLSLLFEPGALRGSDCLVTIWSVFRCFIANPRGLTCEESNPVRNAIECHFSAVAFSGTVLFGT